jgi:molybdopterin-guanine dinucleotide biosynthesis protein A
VVIIRDNSKNLAVSILVGGKSKRFGSDKGLFEFRGKPLISHQIETLTQGEHDIFLIAHSKKQVSNYIAKIDIKGIMAFIIDDNQIIPNSDIYTPMIGLYSAFKDLKKLNYKKMLALACDNPFIQYNIVKYIIERSKDYDCCIPKWDNGFVEPLFAIYPVEKSYERSKNLLMELNFKLANILNENWKINYISIENSIQPLDYNLSSFVNINEPSDLERLKNQKV